MPRKTPLRAKMFAGIFCAVVGGSFAAFHLLAPWFPLDNRENRLLTDLPQVLASAPGDLIGTLDSFLADNAPFRYQLTRFRAAVEYRLFGAVADTQVLAGREGWLFFCAGPDLARPLGDYQGLPDRNDTEHALAAAAASLQRLSDALAANGCTLVLDIAPAKERLYREYMPAGYPIVDETNRADRLAAYLAANTDVPVNWPYAALRERILTGKAPALYYRTDTHWTWAGALFSLDGIFDALGVPTLPFERYTFAETGEHTGDLANLGALYAVLPAEPETEVIDYAGLFAPDPRTVGVIGDSFSVYYLPYLEQRFAGTWRQPLESGTLAPPLTAAPACDILIVEATERNLDTLLAQLAAF